MQILRKNNYIEVEDTIGQGNIQLIRGSTIVLDYTTWAKARSSAQNGDIVKFGKGVFEINSAASPLQFGNYHSVYFNSTYANCTNMITKYFTVVGENQNTVLNVRSDSYTTTARDNYCFVLGTNCVIRNLVINYRLAEKSTTYSNAIATKCGGAFKISNVLFKSDKFNSSLGTISYLNSGTAGTFEYCTFMLPYPFAASYINGTSSNLSYCAFNNNSVLTSDNPKNCVVNQTIDSSTYKLSTNNTKYGIYGGSFAWK